MFRLRILVQLTCKRFNILVKFSIKYFFIEEQSKWKLLFYFAVKLSQKLKMIALYKFLKLRIENALHVLLIEID